MPLDPHEVNSLYLSGTIRIPHTPPVTGDLYLIRHTIPGTQAKQDFLRVVHEVHDGLRFTYLLRVKDVRAVKLSETSKVVQLVKSPKQKAESPKGSVTGPDPMSADAPRLLLSEYIEELLQSTPPGKPDEDELWITDAAVFLPEGAPVHVQTHAGLSAADSAEFHPRAFSMQTAKTSPCDTHLTACDTRHR